MLVRATIENFQAHKKTVLEFHKGINIITGPTDSGKSAIRRALWWNFTNRPVGTKFVSDWNKDAKGFPVEPTRVLLEFDDASVERVRVGSDADDNQYKIGGLTLGAIGKDALPPPEVLKAWNINESNFSGQHDPPFLLSIPAGQVAEYLNRSVHLELIDEALTRADVDKRALNKELKQAEADCKAFLEQVNALRWVDKAQELFKAWEAKSADLAAMQAEKAELEDLLSRLENMRALRMQKDSFLKKVELLVAGIEPKLVARKADVADYNELLDLVEGVEKAEKQIKAKNAVIDAAGPLMDQIKVVLEKQLDRQEEYDDLAALLKGLGKVQTQMDRLPDVTAVSKMLVRAEKLLGEFSEERANVRKLQDLLDDLSAQKKLRKEKDQELIEVQQELIDALDGQCPVCGGEYHGEESHG